MATTILATAGRTVAGPWGAALGALAGQALDRATKARRADDLPLTSSAYGTAIPRIFGTARVAGNLVWSTPVRPSETGKGGAGRGAVASFALVLALAPVTHIGRIWADGALLRDADGRVARRFTLREHLRGRAVADPLIAAAHQSSAPGYAGLCYVVWENLDLAPFGDRIPNLVFEVTGEAGGPDAWAASLLGCAPARSAGRALGMVAAAKPRDDGAIAALLAGLRPAEAAGGIRLAADGAPLVIDRGDATEDGRPETTLRGRDDAFVEVAYVDAEREFQRGVQRAGSGGHGDLVELPAVLDASSAGALAARLAAENREAETTTITLPWRWLHVQPGDLVRLRDGRSWRVVQRTVTGLCLELSCCAVANPPRIGVGDAGGAAAPALRRVPASSVALFELPGLGVRAFVGGGAGWEGASLLAAFAPQGAVIDLGYQRDGASFGTLAADAEEGADVLAVTIEDAEALAWSGTDDMESSRRRIIIAGEVIGYLTARPASESRLMLSGLVRGAAGTLAMVRSHAAGSEVVLLTRPDDLGIGLVAAAGTTISVVATGPGDEPSGVVATLVVTRT